MTSVQIDGCFASGCFDVIFVHRRSTEIKANAEAHQLCVRKALALMREHSLYVNLKNISVQLLKGYLKFTARLKVEGSDLK